MAHHIRLAGPWDRQHVSQDASGWIRCQLPVEIDSGDQLRRHFHQPTGLEATSQLGILVNSSAPVSAELNEVCLSLQSGEEEHCFEIGQSLQAFNSLILTAETSVVIRSVQLRISDSTT